MLAAYSCSLGNLGNKQAGLCSKLKQLQVRKFTQINLTRYHPDNRMFDVPTFWSGIRVFHSRVGEVRVTTCSLIGTSRRDDCDTRTEIKQTEKTYI